MAEEASQATSNMDADSNDSFSYNTEHGLFDPALTRTKSLNGRKKRIYAHFDDLQSCYFECRATGRVESNKETSLCACSGLFLLEMDKGHGVPLLSSSSPSAAASSSSSSSTGPGPSSGSVPTMAASSLSAQALEEFSRQLSSCSRYHELKSIASLKYGDLYPSSSIVSSVELDADERLIAMAGVTKRIKIFDYDQVVEDPVEIHYPVREMSGNSKISCLSWNSYIKNHLVSSDYEGLVTLWDSATGQHLHVFEEHERRTWSVDFSRTDPMRLASGSDDSKGMWLTRACLHFVYWKWFFG